MPEKPTSRENEERGPLMTRREFLGFLRDLSVFLAGAGVGTFVGYSLRRIEELQTPRRREVIFYRSGEKISIRDKEILVPIKNWQLFFEKKPIMNYLQRHPNHYLVFKLVVPGVVESPELQVFGPKVGSQAFLLGVEDVGNYWKIVGLPTAEGGEIYLHFKEIEIAGDKGRIISTDIYPIKLNFYTYTPPSGEDERIRIFSETHLPNELLKNLHQLHAVFNRFTIPSVVYIFEVTDPKNRGGINVIEENRIELPSIIFTNPIFTNEGLIVLTHELAHSIVKEIIYNKDQEANKRLFDAYAGLVKAAGWDIPIPSFFNPALETSPYFTIFDESHYVKREEPQESYNIHFYGHPYSDHTELFSSALTILRFFPSEFIQRYNQLNEEQRGLVKEVVGAILNALEFLNPNTGDIELLIPEYKSLKSI
jgi:hypothetical protein